MSKHGNYQVQQITFNSNDIKLIGNLYLPNNLSGPAPALAILGPFCYVKEQAPTQYASRLADEGFISLVFDCRGHGESEGEPRRFENPLYKIADVQAALDYLQTRPEVDPQRLGTLGICQGSSEMLGVVAQDQRIKALAVVTGQYLDYENKVHFLGGADALAQRIERGNQALAKFKQTGEVDYLPIVDPIRKEVGLPHQPIWAWYHGWAAYSRWENRYAVMSDAFIWTFDSAEFASKINCPFLMIHGGHSDGPDAARRHFELIPCQDKQLIWEEETNHLQYYWEAPVIDRAVGNLANWFGQRL